MIAATEIALHAARQRFIPVAVEEIITDLLASPRWHGEAERREFELFARIFVALYHYRFHHRLNELKQAYRPFHPGSDLVSSRVATAEERELQEATLVAGLEELLNKANYEELPITEVNRLLTELSPEGVAISVDLEDFAAIRLFYRGAEAIEERRRDWRFGYLRHRVVSVPRFKRLFLLVKFKSETERIDELVAAGLHPRLARWRVRRHRRGIPATMGDQKIFLKLFQDTPYSQLGILFPNQEVKLTPFDKIRLGVTGGGGTIGGVAATVSKLAAATNPIALAAAFVGLVGLIVRQVMKIFHQRTKYLMQVSQSLYFHNMNNNLGVINQLIDGAEDEECKEGLLAYAFLRWAGPEGLSQSALDAAIEAYLLESYGLDVDFEVSDGVGKLRADGLLEGDEERFWAIEPAAANVRLDGEWDAFFQPAREDTTP
jgi:hypothetical protein